jgi:hypothetical protein
MRSSSIGIQVRWFDCNESLTSGKSPNSVGTDVRVLRDTLSAHSERSWPIALGKHVSLLPSSCRTTVRKKSERGTDADLEHAQGGELADFIGQRRELVEPKLSVRVRRRSGSQTMTDRKVCQRRHRQHHGRHGNEAVAAQLRCDCQCAVRYEVKSTHHQGRDVGQRGDRVRQADEMAVLQAQLGVVHGDPLVLRTTPFDHQIDMDFGCDPSTPCSQHFCRRRFRARAWFRQT